MYKRPAGMCTSNCLSWNTSIVCDMSASQCPTQLLIACDVYSVCSKFFLKCNYILWINFQSVSNCLLIVLLLHIASIECCFCRINFTDVNFETLHKSTWSIYMYICVPTYMYVPPHVINFVHRKYLLMITMIFNNLIMIKTRILLSLILLYLHHANQTFSWVET